MMDKKDNLEIFLNQFYLYYHDRPSFFSKLKEFNIGNQECKEYIQAVNELARHPDGFKTWSLRRTTLPNIKRQSYWNETEQERKNIERTIKAILNQHK
jgi:hypothetical protein